jgi:eukaryotic-like serine/threonine-protein kinase
MSADFLLTDENRVSLPRVAIPSAVMDEPVRQTPLGINTAPRGEENMVEPHRTRRENQDPVSATRREPATEGSSPTAFPSLLAPDLFPDRLRASIQGAKLWKTSGEAQLFLVTDAPDADKQLVLKIYFPHIDPDPTVSAQLPALRSRHIVEVLETGRLADKRAFELMPHLPAGTLRENGAGSHAFDRSSIVEMVRQLTEGLRTLHRCGIIHRDLKPENVLVRKAGKNIDLVLSDFGLSRKLTGTAHFTAVGQTPTYAAPESWAGHVSRALDWWALGMMVLELATGRQPFTGLDVLMVQKAVTTKPVPVDAVTDPRLNRLCAGLLVSDETLRWNEVQVLDWLGGGDPAVPDRRAPIEVSEFEFTSRRFTDITSLTEAMARDWRLAAGRFGVARGPSWRAFTAWLEQFNDPNRNDNGVVEARLDLLGRLERSKEKPDVKLLRLLAGLNQKLPPIYRQAHVDRAKLRELARNAQAEDHSPETTQAREIVDELHAGNLLVVLSGFAGAAELGQVAIDWAARLRELNDAAAHLRGHDELRTVFASGRNLTGARAAMLELAAGGQCGQDWLRQLSDQAAALAEPVPWFDEVRRWVGGDQVRAYAGLYAVGVAAAEADAAVRARLAEEQARQARERAWSDRERQRLDRRGNAIGRASLSVSVLSLLWLFAAVVAPDTEALGLVLLVVLTHWAVELTLAGTLAADYHPQYALGQRMRVAAGRIGRRMRGAPRRWTIGIVVVLLVFGLLAWIAPLAAVLAGAAHLWSGARRHRRWKAAHEQDRQQVTQP